MRKVGLISYVNHSGLGTIAANFRKHLPLSSQFIIKHPVKDIDGETYDIGIPHTLGDLEPTKDQFISYLDTCKPEVVIVVETPFNFDFFKIMHERGIKVILVPMIDSISYEKFIPYEKYIDLVINFTKVGQEIYEKRWLGGGMCGIHIPYPIDTEYFSPENAAKSTDSLVDALAVVEENGIRVNTSSDIREYLRTRYHSTFAHSEGWGGAGYRKSTDLVQSAYCQFEHAHKGVYISIMSQYAKGESKYSQLRKPAGLIFLMIYDLPEAIDLYRRCSIYVAPSRREGLGLPILEAMACGLPVITTNASPMNEWFPEDYPLLVKVQCQTDLPYGDIPMYTPSAFDLMKKMEFAYNNPKLMEQIGETNRIIIQEKFSWTVLRDTYLEFLDR